MKHTPKFSQMSTIFAPALALVVLPSLEGWARPPLLLPAWPTILLTLLKTCSALQCSAVQCNAGQCSEV